MTNYYLNIKKLAKEKGVCIKAIEKSCGMSNGLIGKWNVSEPRADAIFRVAEYLEVPMEAVFTGEIPEDNLPKFTKEEVTFSPRPLNRDETIVVACYNNASELGKARILEVCLDENSKGKENRE